MADEPKETITYDDFAKLDLAVAEVIEAREHPDADRLLLLTINSGIDERQIVAGIRGHYDPASLVGRRIVVVRNLAPRKVRGQVSQGMLLAASDGDDVVLLAPERDVPAGSHIQ